MNTRHEKAMQTKKKIASVALELFNKKGFSNVTVDEIVEKTQTSKGAFYNHFKSKHDIYLEQVNELDSFYVEEVLPELNKLDNVHQKIKRFFFMQMRQIECVYGWDVTRTFYEYQLNPERENIMSNPRRPIFQILYNLCEEGINSGEFRQDLTAEQMVTIFARVIRGILYDWSINNGQFQLEIEQEAYFDVVIKGLRK